VCGIVESGAVSKADCEEESSPDGEADGAGSDAFGEGQAKDTDAHTVDYNMPSMRKRCPSFLFVNGLKRAQESPRLGRRLSNVTDGPAPITQ